MRGIAMIVVVLGLTACGSGDDRSQVSALFDRLDRAQSDNDADTACEKVFLVAEEGRSEDEEEGEKEQEGEESPDACRRAFSAAASARRAQVKRLRTTVKSVRVDGDEATATVRSQVTRADGSTFSNVYTRDLVRRDGKWRIRISPEG